MAHYDTQYNHKQNCLSTINSAFSRMRIYRLTHDKGLEILTKEVYNSNSYKRLTRYNKNYLQGYIESQFNENYKYYLVWGLKWIDGKFYNAKTELENLPDFSWDKFNKEVYQKDGNHGSFLWKQKDDKGEYRLY